MFRRRKRRRLVSQSVSYQSISVDTIRKINSDNKFYELYSAFYDKQYSEIDNIRDCKKKLLYMIFHINKTVIIEGKEMIQFHHQINMFMNRINELIDEMEDKKLDLEDDDFDNIICDVNEEEEEEEDDDNYLR